MEKGLVHNILLLLWCQYYCLANVTAFSSVQSNVRKSVYNYAGTRSIALTKPNQFQVRVGKNIAYCPLKSSRHEEGECSDRSRRNILASSTLALWSSVMPQPAHAGLLQFPCDSLKNRYHFMRAGLSELEADNIYSTNALFLTNRENAMVTTDSVAQSVRDACRIMKESGDLPTVVYHSLAANGMDTGDLLARTLVLGRDRLLPEFTYLDQRGIGLWDSSDYAMTKKAIMALDFMEAGKTGTGGRPPANEDGTPNETLQDQFIRLRQFVSLQESRTSGENILIIFPDGTGPALLSCMIAGIPLNECHCLDYTPGEIRLNISRKSVLEQYNERKEDPDYLAALEEGKENLAILRKKESSSSAFNLKDQKADENRAAMEEAYLREKEKQVEQQRLREEQIQRAKEEQQRRKQELEQQRLEQAQKMKEKKEEQERWRDEQRQRAQEAQQRKKEEQERLKQEREALAMAQVASSSSTGKNEGTSMSPVFAGLGIAVAGLGGVTALAMGGGDDDESSGTLDNKDSRPPTAPTSTTAAESVTSTMSANTTALVDPSSEAVSPPLPIMEPSGNSNAATSVDESVTSREAASVLSSSSKDSTSLVDEVVVTDDAFEQVVTNGVGGSRSIEEELSEIEAAKDSLQSYFDMLEEEENSFQSPSRRDERQQQPDMSAQTKVMNDDGVFGDDYANDWLQVLADIRDEEY